MMMYLQYILRNDRDTPQVRPSSFIVLLGTSMDNRKLCFIIGPVIIFIYYIRLSTLSRLSTVSTLLFKLIYFFIAIDYYYISYISEGVSRYIKNRKDLMPYHQSPWQGEHLQVLSPETELDNIARNCLTSQRLLIIQVCHVTKAIIDHWIWSQTFTYNICFLSSSVLFSK